ncbi:IclR family transcriptional regulator [Lacinutrix sp. MEBiC02595]
MNEDVKDLNLSVVKAFTLLDAFTMDKQEWGVRELAIKKGYNKSTTYRLLNTLESLGVLQKNDNDKYLLGLKLFELGNLVAIHKTLRKYSRAPLENIAREIKETVHFGVLDKNKVLYLNKTESPQGLKVSTQIGSYQKAYCTAIGKVLLAYLPENKIAAYLKAVSLDPCTENTITNRETLQKELKKIRGQEYALDMEELELGLICIAMPVFNNKNQVIASISVSGPSSRFKLENIDNYLSIIKKGARAIEARIN